MPRKKSDGPSNTTGGAGPGASRESEPAAKPISRRRAASKPPAPGAEDAPREAKGRSRKRAGAGLIGDSEIEARRKAGLPPSAAESALEVPATEEAETREKADAGQTVGRDWSNEALPFPVAGIGASAGGLEASRDLLSALPANTGMAFVFVHHLSGEHESVLADILARATPMPIEFAKDGERIEPNHVYVAPPSSRLALFKGRVHLVEQERAVGPRSSIDYFFRSLAEDQRRLAIGVVLSGTGSDGAFGIRAIKAQDGITIAQDPSSAAYDGMPRSAIDTGAVDVILPPREIAEELTRIAAHPYLKRRPADVLGDMRRDDEQRLLDRIFLALRESEGVDFTYYKPTTVNRRIARRMVVHKIQDLVDYLQYIEKNPLEVKALYEDLLINVTGFFREPESFDALMKDVFPAILERRSEFESVRVWVPACSTGEEAYSIAMTLLDAMDGVRARPAIQVFGTDVSDSAIAKARQGIYSENVRDEVGARRLEKYFVPVEGGYQVSKTIRDACVFAKHDVTKDPPFSRLDLISCRNLLIYLGSVLQKRLIPLFHYALVPQGFLILGSSESIGSYDGLFGLVNQKYKIYAKKEAASPPPLELGLSRSLSQMPEGIAQVARTLPSAAAVQREADRIAAERFVPPGVLVNAKMEILQFRGDTSPYLRHPSGHASLNLLEMAREDLQTALRSHLANMKSHSGPSKIEGVRVTQDRRRTNIDIEVMPVTARGTDRYYLVFFKQTAVAENVPAKGRKSAAQQETDVDQLRRQIDELSERLRVTSEEKESSVEELRAANEEIQSANEELSSINEELETAKEELQSTNEELTTLNEELQNRNFELLSANDDLRNVLTSVNIPIIILGKDLRIRRYTPIAERVLNLITTDIGRPITDLKLKIDADDLPGIVKHVLETLEVTERDVRDENGRWYSLQVRPYRTIEDRIEGVVVTLLDVDEDRRLRRRASAHTKDSSDSKKK